MKKMLSISIFLFGLFVSTNANAAALVVFQGYQLAKEHIIAASAAATEAKTTLMEAWDKSVWKEQLFGMLKQLQTAQKELNELVSLRDDFMNTLSGARDIGSSILTPNSGSSNPDYHYADRLPSTYSGSSAYIGTLSNSNSTTIRDAWKVNTIGFLKTDNITAKTNAAAESNAQQIAVIQAMAQEAYSQAALRVQIIADLERKITDATAAVNSKSVAQSDGQNTWEVNIPALGNTHTVITPEIQATQNQYDNNGNLTVAGTLGLGSLTESVSWSSPASSTTIGEATAPTTASAAPPNDRNDLKRIADLQAQIQVQQALLQNEQNKLASLAILQQSQRDAYEQQKREIAAYANKNKSDNLTSILGYVGVAALQKASYEAVAGWYSATTE
ncbi:type IV secretion system protein [Methylotenera sp. G11]|uniref:type IV secretion system protein n=1 Tax=Methylotenera sp. G11 TaxID=1506585 RepID=UPI0006463FBB|nr:type IV secretion system protein [Methylotenera sp. G11]